MDPVQEFRKHAADCRKMAKASDDPETSEVWARMADRWLACAKLEEDQHLATRLRAERESSKRPRRPAHSWAHQSF